MWLSKLLLSGFGNCHIFISKVVIRLCAAKKSRDTDHLQNFVDDQTAGLDADKLAADLLAAGREKIPRLRIRLSHA